ncbi:MAG TPA: hypothetical protein VFG47_10315 [Geminicoccaceae bacterium]|nr:hypothetical protein [Geminicoccaceae bacterium]
MRNLPAPLVNYITTILLVTVILVLIGYWIGLFGDSFVDDMIARIEFWR